MLSRGPSLHPGLLTVYGHVGFDVSTILGNTNRTVGGSAYYASIAAEAQGGLVRLTSVLGTDFPHDHLDRPGIDLSACHVSTDPSAVFTQTYDEHEGIVQFSCELNASGRLQPKQIQFAPVAPDAIFITTAPPWQQSEALDWLIANHFDGIVAIDTCLAYCPSFRDLLHKYRTSINLLFANADEFHALENCVSDLPAILVKRGREGASLREDGKWISCSARRIRKVKTLAGAGDVLAGTFLASILKGMGSTSALATAVAFASRYVEQGGTNETAANADGITQKELYDE